MPAVAGVWDGSTKRDMRLAYLGHRDWLLSRPVVRRLQWVCGWKQTLRPEPPTLPATRQAARVRSRKAEGHQQEMMWQSASGEPARWTGNRSLTPRPPRPLPALSGSEGQEQGPGLDGDGEVLGPSESVQLAARPFSSQSDREEFATSGPKGDEVRAPGIRSWEVFFPSEFQSEYEGGLTKWDVTHLGPTATARRLLPRGLRAMRCGRVPKISLGIVLP